MAKKPLSFKDFTLVQYRPGEDELTNYKAAKRKAAAQGGGPDEALDVTQRRKKAVQMKRYKSRLKLGKKKALARTATLTTIKKRARKQVRNQLFKKFSKGKSRSEVPPTRRKEIEKRIERFGAYIDRTVKKIVPKVRKQDIERRK
jgi:hypothetical protein